MKRKNILSLLLISLFTLVTACDNSISNSTKINSSSKVSSQISNTSSTKDNTSPSNNTSSISNNSSTISNNATNSYFDTVDAAILESYFDFKIPYIDLEYYIDDYTDYFGEIFVVITFNNASEADFNNYLTMLSNSFTSDGEYDDGTDYWYYFSHSNFLIDICYDDYSDTTPFIYLQIMDESFAEDGNTGGDDTITETPVVDGYFNEEDSAILASYFDFTVPCAGDTYEIYDYSSYYGYTYILFYLNYVDQTEFDSLLATMETNFTNDGTEDYEGLTYYLFSHGDICIDIAYDATGYDYPYIVMEIYDSSVLA